MKEFVELIIPFISTSKNYEDTLKKLAMYAFYWVFIITLVFRYDPDIDALFRSIEGWGPIGKIVKIIPNYKVLNIGGIFIALGAFILSNMFKLHDKISDITGIRRRFDFKQILFPLAELVGSAMPEEKKIRVRERRHELMRKVFYKYASSRIDHPLVDKHDIEHALNSWSWFWMAIEGVFYFSLAAIIAWCLNLDSTLKIFLIITLVFIIVALLLRPSLNRNAERQIQAIAADHTAQNDVRKQFDAL